MNPWLLKNTLPAFDVLFVCRGKVIPATKCSSRGLRFRVLERTSVLDKFFSAKYTCNNPETPKKTRGLSPMAPQCTSKGGPHDEPCRRRGNTRG